MTAHLNNEKLLYRHLEAIAPVPPELWRTIQENVTIQSFKKDRNITGQPYDIHIVLEGMVIKRQEQTNIDRSGLVIDFISDGQYILHMEHPDNCYFQTDSPSTLALMNKELQDLILTHHPISSRHLRHLFVHVLKNRTFRSRLVTMKAIEKKTLFKKEYPQAYRDCSIKDKSSFLGITPYHYSNTDV